MGPEQTVVLYSLGLWDTGEWLMSGEAQFLVTLCRAADDRLVGERVAWHTF